MEGGGLQKSCGARFFFEDILPFFFALLSSFCSVFFVSVWALVPHIRDNYFCPYAHTRSLFLLHWFVCAQYAVEYVL